MEKATVSSFSSKRTDRDRDPGASLVSWMCAQLHPGDRCWYSRHMHTVPSARLGKQRAVPLTGWQGHFLPPSGGPDDVAPSQSSEEPKHHAWFRTGPSLFLAEAGLKSTLWMQ